MQIFRVVSRIGTAAVVAATVFSVARADDAKPAAKVAVMDKAPIICPVMGDKIESKDKAAGKVTYNGKTYYVCCEPCIKAFNAEPAKYAKLGDLRTELAVAEQKVARLKSDIKTVETGKQTAVIEIEAVAAPAEDAVVYCAVKGEAIGTPDKAAAKFEHNGKTYYVCCAGCKAAFEKDPAKWAAAEDKRAAAAQAHD